jgi:hypothetical protein
MSAIYSKLLKPLTFELMYPIDLRALQSEWESDWCCLDVELWRLFDTPDDTFDGDYCLDLLFVESSLPDTDCIEYLPEDDMYHLCYSMKMLTAVPHNNEVSTDTKERIWGNLQAHAENRRLSNVEEITEALRQRWRESIQSSTLEIVGAPHSTKYLLMDSMEQTPKRRGLFRQVVKCFKRALRFVTV